MAHTRHYANPSPRPRCADASTVCRTALRRRLDAGAPICWRSDEPRRARRRVRPQRARGGDHARAVGAARARARGRRAGGRRRRDRGAHAAGLPRTTPSRRFTRPAPPRRCSRACRWSATGCAGSIPPVCYAHPLPDGSAVALYRDLDRTAASLDASTPATASAGARSPRRASRTSTRCARRCSAASRPCAGPLRLAAGLGPRGMLDFARLLLMPAQSLGEELFAGDGPRAWLYGSAMHSDVPPGGAGSAIAAAYLNLLGHGVGWPSPEGGAGRLAEALVVLPAASSAARCAPARSVTRVLARARPRRRRRARRRRAARRAAGDRRRDARRARRRSPAMRCPPATPARCAATATARRRSRSTGRSTGRFPGARPRRAKPAPSTSAARRPSCSRRRGDARRACPSARSCCSASSRSPTPRARPPGSHTAWAYTHGPHTVDWAARARPPRASAWRPRSSASRPGFRERILARHVLAPGRPAAPQRQPRRRRRRRRQLLARPGHLPPGAVARPLPHAGARAVPRQRRHLPGRRGARRARPRRRAPGARRAAPQRFSPRT